MQAHPAQYIMAETADAKVGSMLMSSEELTVLDSYTCLKFARCFLRLVPFQAHGTHSEHATDRGFLQYLVKRKGLDFTDCGMVDARVAKRQRLQQSGQDEAPQSPISIAMVDEWERFQKSFRCAVHAHNDGGELDLGRHLLL